MHRIVIADDEPLARKRLRMMLTRHPGYEIVAECTDGVEAVDALLSLEPDVLFLDIKMPGLDGFEVLAALEESKHPAAIIFATAYADRAVSAFDASAVDFLLKPYDYGRFDRAIRRAEERLNAKQGPTGTERAILETIPRPAHAERFLIRAANHLYFVKAADIEWIDVAGNYLRLHVSGRAHFLRETIRGIEGRLKSDEFVRIHRSTIVNVDFIQRLEPYEHGEYIIIMRDGARLQSSRSYGANMRRLLGR